MLGDILYPGSSQPVVSEGDWVALVQSMASGDGRALNALYQRTHRLVFTLLVRITSDRQLAEELTLDTFCDAWRQSSRFDPANATVLGWVMNLARAAAVDRLRFGDVLKVREQSAALQDALRVLTPRERDALDAAFFDELTCTEVAARLDRPVGMIRTQIRSGLHKLRRALAEKGNDAASASSEANDCVHAEMVCAYAVRALSATELQVVEAHVSACWTCQGELATLHGVLDAFNSWPTDILRPAASVQRRLTERIAAKTAEEPLPHRLPPWSEPEWKKVAPRIACKLLAIDAPEHRVSMLVRLAPEGEYPPHTHSGVEELHLLDGELWIDERKLYPGEYSRAEPGTGDQHVWSETGCTCVLITSTRDVLR
jgi:DNA-directed RNA polymerase specialized sigma24 family protein